MEQRTKILMLPSFHKGAFQNQKPAKIGTLSQLFMNPPTLCNLGRFFNLEKKHLFEWISTSLTHLINQPIMQHHLLRQATEPHSPLLRLTFINREHNVNYRSYVRNHYKATKIHILTRSHMCISIIIWRLRDWRDKFLPWNLQLFL